MARWYVAPIFFKPNGMATYSNKPNDFGHLKVVLLQSSCALLNWWYHAYPSIEDMYSYLEVASIRRSSTCIEYRALGVAIFKSLKSMQILIFPFFLTTGTILEIQSEYWQGLMNFGLRSWFISSCIDSVSFWLQPSRTSGHRLISFFDR